MKRSTHRDEPNPPLRPPLETKKAAEVSQGGFSRRIVTESPNYIGLSARKQPRVRTEVYSYPCPNLGPRLLLAKQRGGCSMTNVNMTSA